MSLVSESHKRAALYTQTVDIGEVGAGATLDVTLNEPNLPTFTAAVIPIPPATLEDDLVVGGAWVVDDDIILRVGNVSAVPVDPAEASWSFMVVY